MEFVALVLGVCCGFFFGMYVCATLRDRFDCTCDVCTEHRTQRIRAAVGKSS